jgi:hypothetical protein
MKKLVVIIGLLFAVAILAVTHVRTSRSTATPAAPAKAAPVSRVVQAAAVPPVPVVHTSTPAARASAAEWKAKFNGSSDYLQFVKAAVPAAKAGDGRAAWYIGQGLHKCMVALNGIYGGADLEAQLQQELAQMHPNTPQYLKDEHERDARRCFALANAKENPWGGPPQLPAYWFAQAYAAGDPLAQEDVAARAAADIMADAQMPEDVRAAKVKVVQDNLRAAVESGDPDALYRAGMLVANPQLSNDTLRGLAVALAACDLGRDCTAANPESGFYECAQSGRCPPGLDFPTMLQQGMGQEQYAQVYARSQQVVLSARAGDWNAVLANLTIDKHP